MSSFHEVRILSYRCQYCGVVLRSIPAVKKHLMNFHRTKHLADIERQREAHRKAAEQAAE